MPPVEGSAIEGGQPSPGILYPRALGPLAIQGHDAGWSSPVARQAHNLKVLGSNPSPATKKTPPELRFRRRFCLRAAELELGHEQACENSRSRSSDYHRAQSQACD